MTSPRFYSRQTLLSLSKSDKVRCPAGLKPLSEWYGEYEPPQIKDNVTNTGNQANGQRYAANRERGEREQGGARARGAQDRDRERDRDGNEQRYERSDSRNNGTNGAAPATGAMGDFRLAGSRPALNMRDSDDKRRSASGRESDLRDTAGSDRRPWSASATANNNPTDPAARRNPGGDFVKKDGRAAEEGGWRSSKENGASYRERPGGNNIDRERRIPSDRNDRNDRDRGDRRRQPAWMDEQNSNNAFSSSPGASLGFPTRRLPGRESGGSSYQDSPAWMAPETNETIEDSLEGLEDGAASAKKEQHVDSIQAWKAEMREMEKKQKLKAEKELRKEMGLPELDDKDLQRKIDAREGKVDTASHHEPLVPEANKGGPAKSVFADFLLPGPRTEAKEPEAPSATTSNPKGIASDKPRSSRFARFFDAQGNQTSGPVPSSAQAKSPEPAYQASNTTNERAPSTSHSTAPQGQDLLAALLPGFASSRNDTSISPRPVPSQADAQSMMRLMEMLHMSSASPNTSSTQASPQPPPQHSDQRQQNYQQLPLQQGGSTQAQQRPSSIGRASPHQQVQQSSNTAFEAPRQAQPQSPPPSTTNALQAMFAQATSQSTGQPSRMNQSRQQTEQGSMMQGMPSQPQSTARVASNPSIGAGLAPPQAQQAQSRRGFAVSPQSQTQAVHSASVASPSPPQQSQASNAQHLLHLQQQQQMRSPPPSLPAGHNPNVSQQQQAQMAAFMAAQLGAGRVPPGLPSQIPQQYQSSQSSSGQQQQPQSSHSHQHQTHHGRSAVDPAQAAHQKQLEALREEQYRLAQIQQQRQQQQLLHQQQQAQYSQQNQSPPPASQFAQQNALAQFLAQSGNPNASRPGPASYPLPPPTAQYQHQTGFGQGPSPQVMHHGQYNQQAPQQQPMQQNQIDLMALLTGATRR